MDLQGHSVAGRVVLITGASSGLGAHFARLLSRHGAKVVLAARRTEQLLALEEDIRSTGGNAISVSMDVAEESSVIAAYDAAERAFNTVDTIIANAGIGTHGLAVGMTADAFAETFNINVQGAFLTAREGARRLIASDASEAARGRVILVSSSTATTVTPNLSAYAASKAALVHLGKHLSREWAREGINVNTLQPGYIRTDINNNWFDTEGGQRQIKSWPRRRLMPLESLDGMLLYLSSDASASVTGASFLLDDGQSL
jgi:NAD(P)-dependent dehydrogenase (short-subunit alcohol dehydrogenase family)